jgi:hypothetical protein
MLGISKIRELMLKFQKENGVVKQCVTNTQYLYDCVKANTPETLAKAQACIVLVEYPEIKTVEFIGHVVLKFEDRIIDPSYEVYSKENKSYYATIAELMDVVEDGYFEKIDNGLSLFREMVSNHIEFVGMAKTINGGGCCVCNKEFYNAQADYVEANFPKKYIC